MGRPAAGGLESAPASPHGGGAGTAAGPLRGARGSGARRLDTRADGAGRQAGRGRASHSGLVRGRHRFSSEPRHGCPTYCLPSTAPETAGAVGSPTDAAPPARVRPEPSALPRRRSSRDPGDRPRSAPSSSGAAPRPPAAGSAPLDSPWVCRTPGPVATPVSVPAGPCRDRVHLGSAGPQTSPRTIGFRGGPTRRSRVSVYSLRCLRPCDVIRFD